MMTAQWKLTTSIKILLYNHNPGHPLRIFDRSYYVQPESVNKFGYGRVVRPRTEHSMHQDCIHVMNQLNWRLVAQEWCVSPGVNHLGQGDLVFQKPCREVYMVMEVKRRNSKYVYKQSEFYARKWREKFTQDPQTANVYYGVWTSYTQEIIGKLE